MPVRLDISCFWREAERRKPQLKSGERKKERTTSTSTSTQTVLNQLQEEEEASRTIIYAAVNIAYSVQYSQLTFLRNSPELYRRRVFKILGEHSVTHI